jgi:tRNA threonylcarbamoyladenosine biosynthesis protein TsaE
VTGEQPLSGLSVAEVGPAAAETVVGIVHTAFGARPTLDPPATALDETTDTVRAALSEGGGLLASVDGRPVGSALLVPEPDSLLLRRVAVLPEAQHHGVAHAMAARAEVVARRRGLDRVRCLARAELPGTVRFWSNQGYVEVAHDGTSLTMVKELPAVLPVPTAEAMHALGRRIAGLLRAGDVVVLTGELGAGKTTLTQGLGEGLHVRGGITSPTFVISRIHPPLGDGPALVHVDAYRLGGLAELDDLDLDVSVEESVTVVEWGEGLAELLADDRLEVTLTRSTGADEASADGDSDGEEERTAHVVPVGARWVGAGLSRLVA